MATFHFSFDLSHFGFTHQNFYTGTVWIVQRTCIVSIFLFCAGFGQAIALRQNLGWSRFWRRWAQVAGCALLVSVCLLPIFPRSYITFGVLHCMAVALVVMRLTAGARLWLLPLGLAAVLAPHFIAHPFFDTRWTNWVGLVTRKPYTEDYVPLLPWMGVMWWGLAAGQWVLTHRPGWVAGPAPRAVMPLAALGRWSLTFYMVHQPVLFGLTFLFTQLR
ncbi:MAG: DUF1624 domain-containing protein [Proteobacteria bacterium]|nr:DUF1624 domain-containing protein [Pseudomonadota bacterium]